MEKISQYTTLIEHLTLKPTHFGQFLEIVRAHGANSLRNEVGCLGFEILVPEEPKAHVILIETYTSKVMLESHWNSQHMEQFRKDTDGMVIDRTRYICNA